MADHQDQKLRVLVVWEPILTTDWRSPTRSTLARLPDPRVRQFWDKNHVVSAALTAIAAGHPPQPRPDCCIDKGFYWDEAILFPPGTRWNDSASSAFWNGPVVKAAPGVEKSLAAGAVPVNASPVNEAPATAPQTQR